MKLRLLAFTQRGYDLARELGEKLGGRADRCGSRLFSGELDGGGFPYRRESDLCGGCGHRGAGRRPLCEKQGRRPGSGGGG